MKTSLFLLILAVLFSFTQPATAVDTPNDTLYIHLRDYGLYKTRDRDAVKYINEALKDIQGDQPKVLLFSPGEYHFYPYECTKKTYFESNTSDINPKACAFLFEKVKNLTIDGRGATLIFHDQMQPFTFDNCQNIVLKNLRIDWEYPLIAQGKVMKVTDQYIELSINQKEVDYRIENDKLYFPEGENLNPWNSTMEFDNEGRYVVPQTGDRGCLGSNWRDYRAVATMPGILRLYNNFERKPKTGNFLVMRFASRAHSGVFITDSKNITVQNLFLFHATGLGILAQFSEDLTFDQYRAIPNLARNHYFGGGDDGLQVSNCKGLIKVTNCEFAGLMDDPINVHGTSVQVQEIMEGNKLKCKFMHNQSSGMVWGHKGDRISFIENERMNSIGSGEVVAFQPLSKDFFVLTFSKPVPKTLEVGDALENLTWSPDVEITHSQFKSCRARGLLVSTPGKVVIENNNFESSGSAILIAGDANGWFESGAVKDVTIRNNTFGELCNTSSYQFCEAIISVYPIIPKLDEATPCFHRNIKIENNRFHPFDYPVLFARSVDGITFNKNELFRSYTFEPYHARQYTFTFEYCKNVQIRNNQFSNDLLGKNILLKKTAVSELDSDVSDTFDIEKL
ncbi:right-handed parallel beta-helix repeat-containing protein [Maribellus sp. YY47]|uniref:right-handed parallel beta-helix repeat-containing protein n=1 Tax=Maribellus sp. YY47 TaxID=2929486 RepID=UPI00200076F8|nr:right-handed parallel beta-helix repeat-containing protein [Maribellus sp. YY47]MCK3686363.1 right-handed parallel beta-helix repeat-containing protein [Maribellus sp. YY47]